MRFIISLLLLFIPSIAFCDGRLERCEPYRAHVESILEKEGVSKDFYFLMVAESGCRDATSDKGARGFWQLTAPTARHYGCTDRSDLDSATRAAARYLKHLGERFESFEDIIRAYNQGGHNFARYGASRESSGLVLAVKRLRAESQKNAK